MFYCHKYQLRSYLDTNFDKEGVTLSTTSSLSSDSFDKLSVFKHLSSHGAYYLAASLIIISLTIDLLFNDVKSFIVILLTILGVIIYSPFAKRFPLFKGFYTSLLCCAPLQYGLTIAKVDMNLLLYIPIIIFITGREILLDIYDLEGDKKNNIYTIPIRYGVAFSRTVCWTLMIVGCSSLIFLSGNIIGIFAACISALIVILLFIYKKGERTEILFTQIAMMLGCISIALLLH